MAAFAKAGDTLQAGSSYHTARTVPAGKSMSASLLFRCHIYLAAPSSTADAGSIARQGGDELRRFSTSYTVQNHTLCRESASLCFGQARPPSESYITKQLLKQVLTQPHCALCLQVAWAHRKRG